MIPTDTPPPVRSTLHTRTWVVAGLVIALMLYGVTGTLVQMLGAAHFHRSPSVAGPSATLQDFRRADRRQATPSHAQPARHHHGRDDATVVAIGERGADDAQPDEGASVGVACQMPVADSGRGLPAPSCRAIAWRAAATRSIADRHADRPERPPRA